MHVSAFFLLSNTHTHALPYVSLCLGLCDLSTDEDQNSFVSEAVCYTLLFFGLRRLQYEYTNCREGKHTTVRYGMTTKVRPSSKFFAHSPFLQYMSRSWWNMQKKKDVKLTRFRQVCQASRIVRDLPYLNLKKKRFPFKLYTKLQESRIHIMV